jgi:hypothetical protein
MVVIEHRTPDKALVKCFIGYKQGKVLYRIVKKEDIPATVNWMRAKLN